MQDKQTFVRVIITIIFYCLGSFFGALMYPRLDIALADLPFILRVFVSSFMIFFMFIGMVCFIWGIVILLQRARPQFYGYLVVKIFGPKQLIFIGTVMLEIPLSFAVLLFFDIFFMFLENNLSVSAPLARELGMNISSVLSSLSSFFTSGFAFLNFIIFTLVTGISLIIKGNEQLKAIEQNQYYTPQVMYPPLNQQR